MSPTGYLSSHSVQILFDSELWREAEMERCSLSFGQVS